jgi:hypothetical protein
MLINEKFHERKKLPPTMDSVSNPVKELKLSLTAMFKSFPMEVNEFNPLKLTSSSIPERNKFPPIVIRDSSETL